MAALEKGSEKGKRSQSYILMFFRLFPPMVKHSNPMCLSSPGTKGSMAVNCGPDRLTRPLNHS
ncbi:MAG TPA: hypothetical protein PLK81_10340, partial [Kiritimatiellia bacterium]|nr:hypothetical protein [Kiritimatiellia bacterium]